jgi:hypothetical protein
MMYGDPTTWRQHFKEAFEETGEHLSDLVFSWRDGKEDLDRFFDCGFGGPAGTPFVAWSPGYVYFSYCYDGAEGIRFVPRNPTDEHNPDHVGSW